MVLSSTNLFGLISVNGAQVTKTEMVTPTLSSFMSDVRSMDVSFESIPKYKIEKSVTYFSLFQQGWWCFGPLARPGSAPSSSANCRNGSSLHREMNSKLYSNKFIDSSV